MGFNKVYFFEFKSKDGNTTADGWENSHTHEYYICKICGDSIDEYVGPTLGIYNSGDDKREKHIDLHKTIKRNIVKRTL